MKRQPMPKTVEGTIITRAPAHHAAALGLHLLHKYMNGAATLLDTMKMINECGLHLVELAESLAHEKALPRGNRPQTKKKASRKR